MTPVHLYGQVRCFFSITGEKRRVARTIGVKLNAFDVETLVLTVVLKTWDRVSPVR